MPIQVFRVAVRGPGLAGLTTIVLCGCHSTPLELHASFRALSVPIGQEFNVRTQTIGPGQYSSPPPIAGAAVRFLGMGDPGLPVPAGATQKFLFRAQAVGRSIITFHPEDGMPGQVRPDIQDTVYVF
jgi:hypothetical protein